MCLALLLSSRAAPCLPACLGGGRAGEEALDTIGPTSTTKTPASGGESNNRLNLVPQDLYQVDEFPMELQEAERWVVIRKPKPKAKFRMLCLPWTGGNSNIFSGVWDSLPSVECVAIELPGRQARMKEKPYRHLHPLVAKLAEALEVLGYLRHNAPKLIFYGHSFGSLIGYEVAVVLRKIYNYTPHYFIVAAGITPKEKSRWATEMAKLDDDQAVATVVRHNLVPEAVATGPDFKVLYLPVFRADYNCMDTYVQIEHPPFSFPILTIVGSDDGLCHGGVGKVWEEYTTSTFTLRTIKGRHYFTQTNKPDTVAAVDEVVLQGKTQSDPIVIPTKTTMIHDLPM